MRRTVTIGAVVALAALAGCESTRALVTEKEDHLAAAGFVVQLANTPQRAAMLSRLPAHHFLRRVHGNDLHYVYADPTVCDCLYVGTQAAYDRYRQYQQQHALANEEQMTASDYQDASWNWGMWGPWGPGDGFGYGPGWGMGW
ncbi:hypothetical protein [Acidomonas methanolica]|uniref:hypothetical protein n=1 Tax=Acidomonas methanolica TaxID=437 RepID=UPI00211A4F47|nr:hypothetical protein [Acidomonas methanolica]MCQ9155308.1 hypothetical protein [Acidomonas methanolica]